ncbi:type III-A CRISPR-associated RAMP protein Csm5 [Lactococcus hodotermopsidis]|uniref:CRISPR system Cms protein Csm5 n=1 Tax=Pseudolactococcus hodotermopsidis TaxID=2709157 RepID=A0A6A0BAS8_9LACT|nr:type III-A CRISPR-associated RAMP protein Csm5 [Lactococcus hodotermopsidis]GFH41494.1 type III-A CRISPR-associated RAMP protein Csm5 [Lactococcus hodotermopsidis]
MKSEFLKRFKITLMTEGPLHIGNGNTYTKKELYFDGKSVYVLDMKKFYLGLNPKLQVAFEEFVSGNPKEQLSTWIKTKRLENFAKTNSKYQLPYSVQLRYDGTIRSQLNEVHEFIKDAFGNPYIPGNSLKGALRTVILSKLIEDKINEEADFRQKCLSKIEDAMKNKAKTVDKFLIDDLLATLILDDKNEKDAKNDILRALRISDSLPLKTSDFIFIQKKDKLGEGTRKGDKGHQISTYRECLKPGTKIEFDVVIDTSIFEKQPDDVFNLYEFFKKRKYKTKSGEEVKSSRLEVYLRKSYQKYKTEYLNKFGIEEKTNGIKIYLGGGIGFLSKTVWIALLEKKERYRKVNEVLNSQFGDRNTKVYRDNHREVIEFEGEKYITNRNGNKAYYVNDESHHGASPRTLKISDDNKEIGKTEIKIEEICS